MAAPFLPLWRRAQDQDTLPPPRRQRFHNAGFLVVDDDYEPMDVERRPPVPMPPHLSLAGLPPRVIAVMVHQAALTARASATPANEIYAWMRDFCRAATNAELQCDDNLFRLALGAFGEVPEKAPGRATFTDPMTRAQRAARGEEYTGKVDALDNVVPVPAANAPPGWSGFGTWRSLFGALCDAAHNNWRDQQRSSLFWKLGTGNREVVPYSPTQDLRMAAKLYNPNQSKRDLDLVLDALLLRLIRYTQISGVEELKSVVAQWLGGWPKTEAWMSEQSWWMALVTWAILRGARGFQAETHKQADRSLYAAISGLTWPSMGVDVKVAASQIKTALEAGADPNLYEDTIRTLVGILPPNKPEDWNRAFPNGGYPPVFLLALRVGHPEIIRLLVEGGASRTAISGSGFQPNNARFFQAVMFYLRSQQPQSDRPTTEKLLGMLGDYFFWRSTRAGAGPERGVFQREADMFQQLIRDWTERNNEGSLAATVPNWFFEALRKVAARTPEGRRARVRARE